MPPGKMAVPDESRAAIQLLITVFYPAHVPDPWEGNMTFRQLHKMGCFIF